jgi:hypothetical protein
VERNAEKARIVGRFVPKGLKVKSDEAEKGMKKLSREI